MKLKISIIQNNKTCDWMKLDDALWGLQRETYMFAFVCIYMRCHSVLMLVQASFMHTSIMLHASFMNHAYHGLWNMSCYSQAKFCLVLPSLATSRSCVLGIVSSRFPCRLCVVVCFKFCSCFLLAWSLMQIRVFARAYQVQWVCWQHAWAL